MDSLSRLNTCIHKRQGKREKKKPVERGVRPWDGQLGVATWGWLQSPFFIVCLKQGHFFLSFFSSIFMNFLNFFLQNIMGREKKWGGHLGF
jgi:hypothetical protein